MTGDIHIRPHPVTKRPIRRTSTMPKWAWGMIGAASGIAVWAILALLLADSGARIAKIAGPVDVALAIIEYSQESLLQDLLSSLGVFIGGWAAGSVLATFSGLLFGRIRLLRRTLLPIIEAIRPVSSIAWIPLSIVWFGFGYTGKIFLVGLAVYLVVIVYAVDGATRIAPTLERTATMLGMGRWQKMYYLVLPSMLSEVLIGLRVALMAGWGTVIIAELVAADSGMGNALIRAQQGYDIPAVMGAMLCFGAVGFLLNVAFDLAQRFVRSRRGA